MVELVKTPTHLEIKPTDIEALQEARDIHEALEHHLCNGWRSIEPEEIGALTEATIITDDYQEDDHGNLTQLGSVYWDSDYQVTDALDELRNGKTVRWDRK